jgi:hypothetical protein
LDAALGLDSAKRFHNAGAYSAAKLPHLAGRNQVLYATRARCDNNASNRVWFKHLT